MQSFVYSDFLICLSFSFISFIFFCSYVLLSLKFNTPSLLWSNKLSLATGFILSLFSKSDILHITREVNTLPLEFLRGSTALAGREIGYCSSVLGGREITS